MASSRPACPSTAGTDSGTLDRDLICLRNATTVDFTTGTISGVWMLTGSFDYGIDDVTINGNDRGRFPRRNGRNSAIPST